MVANRDHWTGSGLGKCGRQLKIDRPFLPNHIFRWERIGDKSGLFWRLYRHARCGPAAGNITCTCRVSQDPSCSDGSDICETRNLAPESLYSQPIAMLMCVVVQRSDCRPLRGSRCRLLIRHTSPGGAAPAATPVKRTFRLFIPHSTIHT